MPIRQPQYPIRFFPAGLVDAFDATEKFPGACIELSNMVFDQSNPEIAVARPGATSASIPIVIARNSAEALSRGVLASRTARSAYSSASSGLSRRALASP